MTRTKEQGGTNLLPQRSFIEGCARVCDKTVFTFHDNMEAPVALTGGLLLQRVSELSTVLQRILEPQERALLLLPQGPDYISSILACFSANVIAVPLPVTEISSLEQMAERIMPLLKDSEAGCLITNSAFYEFLKGHQAFSLLSLLNVDDVSSAASNVVEACSHEPDDLAMLLYTSGSTSLPKGVMLSHRNLLSQAGTGAMQWGMTEESRIVSWMPQFHNFGLHFNILAPLMQGASSIILSPGSFMTRPEEWFKSIDRYQATHTAAPNFAFDYCCNLLDLSLLEGVDLSSIQAIVCGGEPIRKETYETFLSTFQQFGLKKHTFCPHYGLSEVGSVTTHLPGKSLRCLALDIPSLEEGKVKHTQQRKQRKPVVSCGKVQEGSSVVIVNSDSEMPCEDGEIGEVWIKSPSAGLGYWNRPLETQQTFDGTLGGTQEKGFLRTGDVGFLEENRLYIVGREKEVIIIHGKNHHPVDIEWTIKKQLPQLSLPGAVFSYEIEQRERVFMVQELPHTLQDDEYTQLIHDILRAVSENHGLTLYAIQLVLQDSLPRTGSGKVQRNLCKRAVKEHTLPVLYSYRHEDYDEGDADTTEQQSPRDMLTILKRDVFLPLLHIPPRRLETVSTLSELGLNSLDYVRIAKRIEDVLNILFAPAMLFKYQSFEQLAHYLSTQLKLPSLADESENTENQHQHTERSFRSGDAVCQTNQEGDIAIIGMSCHLPGGANDPEVFWEQLIGQQDGIRRLTECRPQIFAESGQSDSLREDVFPAWGGFLDDVDRFDARFFGISRVEAESMDPQQRKLLELTWNVLEQSGYNPLQLAGQDVGVFVGVHNNDYAELVTHRDALMGEYGAYLDSGLHMSLIANRVSRWFNFHGPSEVINTACSSSLVAIHHAVESLNRGESSLAIAGGINLILSSRIYRASHKAGMLAADGRCKTFDHRGDGFVRAEGYGAVVLKPYHQACQDGDHIYGILKGVTINHDGHSNSLRAPNLQSQKKLIETAYTRAGVPPETVSYIEAHGTGTALGDPIEIQALQEAFQTLNPHLPPGFCGLGSVKTNIGHCESAAGIAGLIKVLLAFRYRTLPGMLHFQEINPYISLEASPFYIVAHNQEWTRLHDSEGHEIPRRAGVSSFGFGGVNAHLIVEEDCRPVLHSPASVSITSHKTSACIIPLSAKTPEVLLALSKKLLAALRQHCDDGLNSGLSADRLDISSIAYTLQVGRAALEHRFVMLARDIPELVENLTAFTLGQDALEDCWHGCHKPGTEMVMLLEEDEDSQILIRTWSSQGRLDKLARFWAQGGTIDWAQLYDAPLPCRISLPTYPFAKERYWIPENDPPADAGSSKNFPDIAGDSVMGGIMLSPVWDSIRLEQAPPSPRSTEQVVFVGGTPENRDDLHRMYPQAHVLDIQADADSRTIDNLLSAYDSIDHIVWMVPASDILNSLTEETVIDEQSRGVLQCFRFIKALLRRGFGAKELGWSVITVQTQAIATREQVNPIHASLHGLFGSLAKEFPNWNVRVIDLEAGCPWPLDELFSVPPDPQGNAWVYRDRQWHRQALLSYWGPSTDRTAYRPGGVYVVIGGAGGIGEAWSEYMIRTYQARIIWIGRRQPDANIRAKVERLADLGPAPHYIAVDAGDLKAMQRAHAEIKQRYNHINGVIHSAMVLVDHSLLQLDEQRFRAGLASKVNVCVRLAQVFQHEALDFVLFFSSIGAFTKDHGQSVYSSACTFKDMFAHQLAQEWPCQVKIMNWGYWGDIGAGGRVPQTFKNRLAQDGIGCIDPSEAMEALENLLAGPAVQLSFVHATKPLTVKNIDRNDGLTGYPEQLSSLIPTFQNRIPAHTSEVLRMKAEGDGLDIKDMEELLCRLLWVQLQTLGFFRDKHTRIADVKAESGVREFYSQWLDESLAVLARKHYLDYDGETCVVADTDKVDRDAAWEEWAHCKTIWEQNPNRKAKVVLLESSLRALPDVLTGKQLATDIIFPNSSMELVEGIYKHNQVADYFNDVLAETIAAYLQARLQQDASTRLRILEVGAGIGGTSSIIFQKLKPYQEHIEEYCYTDLSKAFLLYAEQEYGPDVPYLTTGIFDASKPIAGQDVDVGGYDLVISANALHATPHIQQTLRNVKATLRKNGLLLLNELSINALFTHLAFAQLEGWWLHDDPEWRIPGCPGLLPEKWQAVLEREGFRSVFFPAREAHELGFQIVVAESDGIVRQPCQKQRPACPPAGQMLATEKHQLSISGKPLQHSAPTDGALQLQEADASHEGRSVNPRMLREYIKEIVREKLAESLHTAPDTIDDNESFSDYGVDSILGVNFIQILNRSLKLTLKTTTLFEHTSVNQLTTYILSHYKDVIAATAGQHDRQQERETHNTEASTSTERPPVFFNSTPVLTEQGCSKPEGKERTQNSEESQHHEAIAIIGMSGRFAHSNSVEELWEHLAAGTDLVENASRWDLSEYHADALQEKTPYCHTGSFLDEIDRFDPLFFNISGREATYMDPQQRLFLEESWKALEDAGYAGTGVQGRRCGVYVGCSSGDYHRLFGENPPAQAMWGNHSSIIPARIAYYLNLQGPAIAINTACSSSLTAIHLACQGLWTQETELALAGGVFIQCTPAFYITANRAGMLSPTGRCFTFDERADGFVPGEGCGVVVLKRLKNAIADRDHIYGVIRGTGINQDGTTNGITAPSAPSQEQLERYVYDTFNIHPEQIQMVEAHGTGTALGDPIEIEALTRSFKGYTEKTEFCAIGSIKTNIGHTAPAAGVAGLIKILLSLQHKQLPPSLHFQSGNPNISFADSPFYVNTHLKAWDVVPDVPRRAAISAFGFSGTNAHMVIEEAPAPTHKHSEKPGYAIMVSARTPEQLRRQVEQLIEFCKHSARIDLGNMSYTLLTGRKHCSCRVAVVVRDRQELLELLKKWLNKGHGSNIFVSNLDDAVAKELQALKSYGNQCIRHCQTANSEPEYFEHLSALAELYAQGYDLDFAKLFAHDQYSRISLPTYQFARERYWADDCEFKTNSTEARSSAANVLHPLVQQNTSDFSEQRFSSTFTGQEFFWADHVVQGQCVLPAAACLEMARAAVEHAAGTQQEGQTGILLSDMVWFRPIVIKEQPLRLHISLVPEEYGEIVFTIYTQPSHVQSERVAHCRGRAVLRPVTDAPVMNVKDLQAQCTNRRLSPGQCYDAFQAMGIFHGPRLQGLETVYVGQGEVLATLSLPASVSETQNRFVLHPSLLDAAVQASIGLTTDHDEFMPTLPFTLQELEIFGRCTSKMWALVRYCDESAAENKLPKFDIDLCDDNGTVCIRMRGLVSKVFTAEETKPAVCAPDIETLMFHPCWKEHDVTAEETGIPSYVHHLVMLCQLPNIPHEEVEKHLEGVRCLTLQTEEKIIEKQYESYARRVFEELQHLFADKQQGRTLVQIAIHRQAEHALLSGLSGLLKTAQLENPKIIGQVVEVESGEHVKGLVNKLKENSLRPAEQQIRYQKSTRLVGDWSEIAASPGDFSIPWKDRGVYLITGGAGGLGLIFAEEIARHTEDVTLILIGRTPLDEHKRATLHKLEALNAKVEYNVVDVADRKAVDDLIRHIQKTLGGLDGILHSAGVIRDNYILKKRTEEFQEVFSPKVTGLVNLDLATKELSLDFFALFSSIAATLGNAGQADYAAANAFMDAYAHYRNMLVSQKQRNGHTFSVNWPLWQEGGMRMDSGTEARMQQEIGLLPMSSRSGIQAFYSALSSGHHQVMVLEGIPAQMKQALHSMTTAFSSCSTVACQKEGHNGGTGNADNTLRDKATQYFKTRLSSILKLPAHRIDAHAPLEKYGIDSLMIMDLTAQLEKTFGRLSKTLFFEYQTIGQVTEYFLESYRDQMAGLLELPPKGDSAFSEEKGILPVTGTVKSRLRNRLRVISASHEPPEEATTEGLNIAIIGLAGRYPQANNIQEFWKNLYHGKDCITEIPEERWDHSLYFDAEKKTPGKTYSKWGGFLDGVDRFDPAFFNISPREAQTIEPQERLFLETVYETLEDAGYTRETLREGQYSGMPGSIGIYVGVMYEEYQLYGVRERLQGRPLVLSGNPASIANRASYFCNFHGPSMAVDTMCSSSLTAIHLACQSLLRGECKAAIAGGVNVSIHPNKYLMLAQGNFASTKGRCESFGKGGDGYVPGEGVGAVLLKPLARAVADGDHIYGVIKGTAVNHGGKTNGYTVPNPHAQAGAIQRALKEANIRPRTISYLEAHGTGTALGDPIEITGLNKVFQEDTQDKQFCAIGSVKSNIGHCESAAGIAGVTKVLLQLKYRQLVPSLHSRTLNPHIDFSNSPFVVQQDLREWKRPVVKADGDIKESPRIAGISSFGAGGSNAHIIIEEYIHEYPHEPHVTLTAQRPAIIVLSSQKKEQLHQKAQLLLAAITDQHLSNSNLANIAYTLQVGREAMKERLAFTVESMKELQEKLKAFIEERAEIQDVCRGQSSLHEEALGEFATDEDLQKVIDDWIAKGEYIKLLNLWVKGLVVDWNKLYNGKKPRRISLPLYPFARERYWAPETENAPAEKDNAAIASAISASSQTSDVQQTLQPIMPSEPLPSGSNTDSHIVMSEELLPSGNSNDLQTVMHAEPLSSGNSHDSQAVLSAQPRISAESLQKALRESLAKALYMEPDEVDTDMKFVDMGLDSVVGVEWIQAINKLYRTSIKVTKIYDYPSIGELTGFLEKELNKHAGSMNRTSPQVTSLPSLHEIVQQVQQGTLDIEQAENLFQLVHQEGGC